jgi:hypothetical protein
MRRLIGLSRKRWEFVALIACDIDARHEARKRRPLVRALVNPLPVLWTPTHPLRTVCWVICHYGTSVIDLVVECLEAGSITAPQTAYDHILEFLKRNRRSTPTLRIFRIFFPQGSSWFEPLFVPSADSSVSSRAGDDPFAKYAPALLSSAFLARVFSQA